MIVSTITELTITDIYDRSIPNKERIAIIANETINIGQYGIMLGLRNEGESAFPIRDNLFWFGDAVINKGDIIYIYTGPGDPKITELPNNQENLYTVHWGKDKTIFQSNDLVPILFKVDSVYIRSTLPELSHG